MKKFALAHTKWIEEHNGVFTDEEMAYHLQMTKFLQHERLVHLPVMLVSILGLIALVAFGIFVPSYIVLFGILLCFILSFCYIMHYFFLENTVQAWYKIYRDRFLADHQTKPMI